MGGCSGAETRAELSKTWPKSSDFWTLAAHGRLVHRFPTSLTPFDAQRRHLSTHYLEIPSNPLHQPLHCQTSFWTPENRAMSQRARRPLCSLLAPRHVLRAVHPAVAGAREGRRGSGRLVVLRVGLLLLRRKQHFHGWQLAVAARAPGPHHVRPAQGRVVPRPHGPQGMPITFTE